MTGSPVHESIVDVERRLSSGVFGKRDVVLVRGEGWRLWDDAGNEYVDCAAGHGVANIGHAHPRVAAAIADQARTLMTCSESWPNDRRAELLATLTGILPPGLNRLFLCNSGTEAVEAALKFARLATARTGVIATRRAFHGRTFGALSATAHARIRDPFAPLVPGFSHVTYGDLAALEAAVDEGTACVILEVVQGEGGVYPCTTEYLQGVRRLCDERGALLVLDEVQTGFGRTGRMFACEHHDVVPDLLCLGKAIAGGLPMGAVAIGPQVGELPTGSHGSTFGGNPLACAASSATLHVLAEEKLPQQAAEKGEWFMERLRALDSPLVREVRGLGLLVGVELKQRSGPALNSLLERGIIALPAGTNVVRFLPPLAIPREVLERVVQAFGEVLASLETDLSTATAEA